MADVLLDIYMRTLKNMLEQMNLKVIFKRLICHFNNLFKGEQFFYIIF